MSAFTPLLWSILPSQLTHILIPYLSSFLPLLFPPSAKGTPGYQQNYRRAYTALVVGYLTYTFVASEGVWDWYAILGVSKDVDDDGLKRAYRRLSRIYHPDRATHDGEHFIVIRRAYEGLSDPVKRYAYDRFGPEILNWKAASYREYMRQGLQHSSGFYIASAVFMLFLNIIGRAQSGAYWRNTLLALLLTLELSLLTTPKPLTILSILPHFRNQPIFLQIRFLHRAFTSVSIGITQLAGIWSGAGNGSGGKDEKVLMQEAIQAIRALEVESLGAFQETVAPLLARTNPVQVEKLLLSGMEQALIDRAISSHPQIRPLWVEAITKARSDQRQRQRHKPQVDSFAPAATYPFGYGAIPAGYRVQSRHVNRGRGKGRGFEDVGVAMKVPLPDTPPASPRLRPTPLR